MIQLNVLYFLNLFATGVLFMTAIAVFFTGHSRLSPASHSAVWFIAFLCVLAYNLEFTGILNSGMILAGYLCMSFPLLMAYYVIRISGGLKYFSLILALAAVIGYILSTRIPLFQLIWITAWIFLVNGYALYRSRTSRERLSYYTLFWSLLVSASFLPYILTNSILSIYRGYAIHIQSIIPLSLAIASLTAYFLYYRYGIIYRNDDLRESQVREKMSLIEKIAASIVHEIKNPVSAIQSLNEQLMERRETISPESALKYHSIIDKDIRRIRSLADSFLSAFKDMDDEEPGILDVYTAFQSIAELIRFDILKKEVTLTIDRNLSGVFIQLSHYHFRQIFLNMIYNAIEADSSQITLTMGQKKDGMVTIEIQDNGTGIKHEDSQRIFVPFFTTKALGTGLGLSICQKIVDRYSGKIRLVRSGTDGSVFSLSFKEALHETTHS